jgi:class 3 adenylate cyclase
MSAGLPNLPGGQGGTGATVLVVDDDPFNRRMIVRALEKEGHSTIEASDGLEGLKLLQIHEPDVMLLDVEMPELDGYGVLTAMKDLPFVSHIPVVMISGVDGEDAVVRCIELGADDFLPKPADARILRARVNAGLNKKRLHDLQRNHVRLVFSRFLPEQVVDQVLADGDIESLLAARRLTGTVMFTDLRGFTTFAENSPVETVVDVLNRYLGEVTDAVLDAGGTLVGYLGDGVIAAFGAPIETSDHADRALRAAREIVGPRIESFNRWLVQEKQISRKFKTGVGINSGPLMSGNVGSARRLEYTVIGDTINTAARVEAMTKDHECAILLTEEVVDELTDRPDDLRFMEEVVPRGRSTPVRLWTVC